MDLGKKLFELRKKKNLSQEDVANNLNVTRQTVSKWETNQSTPDFDKIVPICELFEISTEELLKEEIKKEDVEENEDVKNEEKLKKHLFTRGKEDKINYENMNKNQINQKSAEVVSSSILLFFIAIIWIILGEELLNLNDGITVGVFLLLIGLGVARIIKHYMSIPKIEMTEKEQKEKKLVKKIEDIIGIIALVLYFIISFATMAWYITWVIFIISWLVSEIVKLIFMLKGEDTDE